VHNGLLVPAFAMIILGLSEENIFSRALSVSVLVLLGEASFALYLIHFIVNDWVRRDDTHLSIHRRRRSGSRRL
jgi:peptidoglycan/LPS O-acetylase OafA/YrhL